MGKEKELELEKKRKRIEEVKGFFNDLTDFVENESELSNEEFDLVKNYVSEIQTRIKKYDIEYDELGFSPDDIVEYRDLLESRCPEKREKRRRKIISRTKDLSARVDDFLNVFSSDVEEQAIDDCKFDLEVLLWRIKHYKLSKKELGFSLNDVKKREKKLRKLVYKYCNPPSPDAGIPDVYIYSFDDSDLLPNQKAQKTIDEYYNGRYQE